MHTIKIIWLQLVLVGSLPSCLFAQNNSKAVKQYTKGQNALAKKDTAKAIQYFTSAQTIDTTYKEPLMALFTIYLSKNDSKCIDMLSKASRLPGRDKPNLLFNLGRLSLVTGNYLRAKTSLSDYLDLQTKDQQTRNVAAQYKESAEYALLHVKDKTPINFTFLNTTINTPDLEYLPSVNATEEYLVFTRRLQKNEDLYIATKSNKENDWIQVQPWGQNTLQNEGAHTISADGKTIVFTKCNTNDGLGSCDLFISELINKKWTKPKNMGSAINTRDWESQPSLSANGRQIFFASNRTGGIGGYDIWMSEKINGAWRIATCLTAAINTSLDEMSPSLHPGGKELFFRSNGKPGFGSFDLFYAHYKNQSWQEAENLGYGINDHQDQGTLAVTINGKKAYHTYQKVNLNNELLASDIVTFQLPAHIQVTSSVFLKGKVLDSTNKLPLANVDIKIINESDTSQKLSTSSDADGEFLMIIPKQTNCQIFAAYKGYDFFSDRIFAIHDSAHSYNYAINLRPIETIKASDTKPMVLKNVLFEYALSKLVPSSYEELDRVVDFLNTNPTIKILISGHTDAIGSPASNLQLSQDRAKAVFDYFILKNIPADRMQYKGFGDTQPLMENKTEDGRAQNRRVEITLLSS